MVSSLCIFVLGIPALQGQKVSKLGRFSVAENKGCAPFTVNITPLVNFAPVTPQYQYESSAEVPTTNTVHTYTQPGEYSLVQIVLASGVEPTTDTLFITVHDPLPPDFTIHNCSSHRVRVEINDSHYDQYRVFFTPNDSLDVAPRVTTPEFVYGTPGNYTVTVLGLFNDSQNNCASTTTSITTVDAITTPVFTAAEVTNKAIDGSIQLNYTLGSDVIYRLEQSENGSNSFLSQGNISGSSRTATGVNTLNNYYCYNINTFDACNSRTIYSDTICSPVMKVDTQNGANLISWETDTALTEGYNIIRNNVTIAQITDPSQVQYEDTEIICNREYCYQLQPIFNTGTSLSADTCIISTETGNLPALGQPFSNVVNQAVELTWPLPPNDIPLLRYVIERSISGRSFRRLGVTTEPNFTDESANFIGSHAYRIKYNDECGNGSEASPTTAPMVLTAPERRGKEIQYSWTRYETWPSGIRSYTLERLDDSGGLIEQFSVLSGRTWPIVFDANDDQPKNIRVRAESLDPTPLISYSNVISTELEIELFLPTAFTPDGNGINDTFEVNGPKVFNYQMQIFSRWGSLIFISEDRFVGWDGTISGKNAPEGTYIYRINFEDVTGKEFNQSGSFVLLRKQ